jgi:anti-sigma-K factor RskA
VKPRDPALCTLLAGEYALGTLRGRARARFELWLRSDPALRREVGLWQERLQPLADTSPEVQPGAEVWTWIEARVAPRARAPAAAGGWWASLAFWRGASFASATLAALVFGWAALSPRDLATPSEAMVVVMADQDDRPAMTVAWMPEAGRQPRLRIRVIGHAEMAPDTAWELWMLPGGDAPPRSLGLITTHETQYVELPAEVVRLLNGAAGMAMSVEPRGGSPTGKPTGPVLYSGRCVQI